MAAKPKIRKKIIERDQYCQRCKKTSNSEKLKMTKSTVQAKMYHRELVQCGLYENAQVVLMALKAGDEDVMVDRKAGEVAQNMGHKVESTSFVTGWVVSLV